MWMKRLLIALAAIFLSGCAEKKAMDPNDPFESFNRNVYRFNKAVDATVLKPPAKVYKAIVPPLAQEGINNFYNNLQMVTSVANDVLQGQLVVAYKDSWRFFINSTIGVLGFIDVAKMWGLPQHYNDLGLTLGRWGNVDSPYLMIPFFGPSTIRDAFGWSVDYSILSVYPFIRPPSARYALWGLSYIDLRSDLLENEDLLQEALDEYSFVRDAYLQNRRHAILNAKDMTHKDHPDKKSEDLYIDEDEEDYVEAPELKLASPPFKLNYT